MTRRSQRGYGLTTTTLVFALEFWLSIILPVFSRQINKLAPLKVFSGYASKQVMN